MTQDFNFKGAKIVKETKDSMYTEIKHDKQLAKI